jgi:hypothetical protein
MAEGDVQRGRTRADLSILQPNSNRIIFLLFIVMTLTSLTNTIDLEESMNN